MAWKWYDVTSYVVGIGAQAGGSYYGSVQLNGAGFYGLLSFPRAGSPLAPASAPIVAGQQRFYGSLDFVQLPPLVDILRNEKPVRIGWSDGNPSVFHVLTGSEPVGEGEV